MKTNTKTKSKKTESKKTNSKESVNEQFHLDGHELIKKVKELIREGNVRRIIIKNEKGKVLMEIPVTFAVVGAVLAPVLAAIGAIAALVSKCTIEVERK